MGNNTSNFVNLDEVSKEKSLFSFNVTLVKLSVKIKKKELTKNMPNYKFKLKLYPSTLTLKNENCNIIDFSYYNIKSWVNDKKFFSFETIDGDSYMFSQTILISITLPIGDFPYDECYFRRKM